MAENKTKPEDIGFNSREWEQFGRDIDADPERALADLERRRDIHEDGGATRPEPVPADRTRDVEAHADDVRERRNVPTSNRSTRAQREAGRAEGERASAERRAAVEEESPHAPQERPSDLFDDPDAPPRQSGEALNRPKLNDETVAAIEAEAQTNEAGQFLDKDRKVIERPSCGHKKGVENRRLIAAAQELGLTQQQLAEFVNAHPE